MPAHDFLEKKQWLLKDLVKQEARGMPSYHSRALAEEIAMGRDGLSLAGSA